MEARSLLLQAADGRHHTAVSGAGNTHFGLREEEDRGAMFSQPREWATGR